MSVKVDVLWSPIHSDRFLTFSSELVLYSVEKSRQPTKAQAIKLSDDSHAYKEAVNSAHQYLKCVSWCPTSQPDHLLALGQANGRVVLSSFGKGGTVDTHNLIGKEFSPKHARQCNEVTWNKFDTNLLAASLEKSRNDYSILIWDVNSRPVQLHDRIHGNQDQLVTKPLVEVGFNEVTSSLTWSPHEPRVLVAGMANKHLRHYDIRDVTHHQNAAITKAVHGLCVDPHCEYRLASFVDDQVVIWDVRSFDRPVLTFRENRNILKIGWCPKRFGLLASLAKDSSVVKLYDVQQSGLGTDELEPAIMERHIHPYPSQQAVSSFSWHPTDENRMLTVTPTGQIRDILIFERIALTWSPTSSLMWTCGRRFVECESQETQEKCDDDISNIMRQRALRSYGLATEELSETAKIDDDPEIRDAWLWLDLVQKHKEEPVKRSSITSLGGTTVKSYSKIYGAISVMKGEVSTQCSKSEVSYNQPGQDFGFLNKIKQYRSDERTKVLDLCGWDFFKGEQALKTFLERLEAEKAYERAAAISLFNLKLKQTIDILKRGAQHDPTLNIVAMALAGFSDGGNSMWKEMCGSMRLQLLDPYLRAMFAFLTADPDNYAQVMEENDVPLRDRLAFACLYLSDQKLNEFIERGVESSIASGKLEGLLLTGLGFQGVNLLQSYVDRTGDVQTAALIAIQAFPGEISRDIRVQTWMESYRDLLDQWCLWHHRAEFDIHRYREDSATPASQVFVSCNFCGKSVSYQKTLSNRSRHFTYKGPMTNKSKVQSCPSCRKPLPRCSLCLVNMGTGSGSSLKQGQEAIDAGCTTPFSSWFTWCQSCRHGGHAHHMSEWFQEHPECPVSGCSCKCMLLDATTSNMAA